MAARSHVPERGVRKRAVLDDSGRWTSHRKVAVLKEIAAGKLSVAEACARWELSLEELQSWHRDYYRYGLAGLKTTRIQAIREEEARRGRYQRL
jgi:hypothetical protein